MPHRTAAHDPLHNLATYSSSTSTTNIFSSSSPPTTTTATAAGQAKGVAFSHAHTIHPLDSSHSSLYNNNNNNNDDDDEDDGEQANALLPSVSSLATTDARSSSAAMTSTHHHHPLSASPSLPLEPYAHPRLALIQLLSNTASSSALTDSLEANVSRRGSYVAIYSSSHIWLIKTTPLPQLWARTLQVKRKPVAMDMTDDGLLLAVLSTPLQVDLYEMEGEAGQPIHKRRTIMLVHEASSVVLSPDARILITGNRYGIEVVAVAVDAPETARRTLSGPAGDSLQFSDDGRTLLITGYARNSHASALFILPGLYDGPLSQEDGEPIPQPAELAWTTSVLFPETARIARQATLLPDPDTGTFSELFAFNADEDSWGIYDIACQRFTQRKMFLPDHQRWTRSEFVDDAMPAVSPNADLAAVALRLRGTTHIWIYRLPGWDYTAAGGEKTTTTTTTAAAAAMRADPIQPCFCIPIPHQDAAAASLQEIGCLRWVRLSAHVQRLVAVGNSSMPAQPIHLPTVPMGSKGVIIVLDFDRQRPAGTPAPPLFQTEYDLDPLCPGDPLPEGGALDFEREVELARSRTLAVRRAQDRHPASPPTLPTGPPVPPLPPLPHPTGLATVTTTNTIPLPDGEELTAEEAQAAFEAPYDNQQPRSHLLLARAATVAAVSPANRRHLRTLPFRPLEYRRADGQRELPHESDADNWVPPPPAYTTTAAQAASVSLSHPDAPPLPRLPRSALSSSSSSSHPSPAPPTSATLRSSQLCARPPPLPVSLPLPHHPYATRQHSHSSIDLSASSYPSPASPASAADSSERRPSLFQLSSFPTSRPFASIRRRNSTTQSPPPTHPTPSSARNSRRPPSTHNNYRHPPSAAAWDHVRRESAPPIPPRVPLFSSPTMSRMSMPRTSSRQSSLPSSQPPHIHLTHSSQPSSSPTMMGRGDVPPGRPSFHGEHVRPAVGRAVLPRLQAPDSSHATGQRLPLSAPSRVGSSALSYYTQPSPPQPRQVHHTQSHMTLTNGRSSRLDFLHGGRSSRLGGRETPSLEHKREGSKRKLHCTVM